MPVLIAARPPETHEIPVSARQLIKSITPPWAVGKVTYSRGSSPHFRQGRETDVLVVRLYRIDGLRAWASWEDNKFAMAQIGDVRFGPRTLNLRDLKVALAADRVAA